MDEGKRFDVESFRKPIESSTEWQMRQSFLELHAGKFPVDRLIYLSDCYVNVEMYGRRYPDHVMKQLRELIKDIPLYVPLKDSSRNGEKEDMSVKKTSRRKGVEMLKCVKESVEGNWCGSTGGSTGNQIVDKTSDQTTEKLTNHDESLAFCNPGPFLFGADDLVEAESIVSSPIKTTSKGLGVGSVETGHSSNTGVETEEQDIIMINKKFTELSIKMCQCRGQQVQGRTLKAVDLLHMVASECQMTVSNTYQHLALKPGGPGFSCELFVDCVSVSTGYGSRKKTAKGDAFKKAVDIFSRSSLSLVENKFGNLNLLHTDMCSMLASSPDVVGIKSNDEPHLRSHNEINMGSNPCCTGYAGPSSSSTTGSQLLGTCQQPDITKASQTNQKKKLNKKKKGKTESSCEETYSDPSQFILIYQEDDNILSCLQRIADFNKVKVTYRYETTGSGWQCETYLGEFLLANGVGIVQKEACISSAQSALAALKEICWSLKEKKRADIDYAVMTKDDLLADLQAGGEALPVSNIGNILLRKMGWTGGGLGKEGNRGITEPVNVKCAMKRQGLGFISSQGMPTQGMPKDFYRKMYKFASDYIQRDNQSEIRFSDEFNKEELSVIQLVCRRLNLKTELRHTGKKKFIVMGRKRNALQLLDYVRSSGGSTERYQAIPPSNLSQVQLIGHV